MPSSVPETPPSQRRTALEAVMVAGALVLFLVMLYEMHESREGGTFVSPLLVAAAGAILIWPLRKLTPVRGLLLAGTLLLVLWMMRQLAGILLPFAAVYLIAYFLEPAVSWLRRRYDVPRWVSAMGFVGLVVGVVALIIVLIVPSLLGEIQTLGARLITAIGDLRAWAVTSPLLDRLAQTGIVDKNVIVAQITTGMQDLVSDLTGSLPLIVTRVVSSITAILGVVTLAAVLPVVLYYLLKDYPFIARRVSELFPTFGGRRDYLVRVSSIVGSYLRGQMIISAIAAFNVGLLLTIFGFPFALLLGLIAGLLNLIPNIGALITMVLGVAVALIFGDPVLKDLVVVVAVLMGQALLEQSILSPKILSSHVGLHPVLIILSLFVFGYFMGLIGLLIAVPLTALLMTFYKAYRDTMTLDLNWGGDTAGFHKPLTVSTTGVADGETEKKTPPVSPDRHPEQHGD